MTFPTATFTAVAPPLDGLTLAFTSARRRRNSKAAVSAFGGAVAIASALSFLAPPGQSLVQEPVQPARGGLLPGVTDSPRHEAPAPKGHRDPLPTVRDLPMSTVPILLGRSVRFGGVLPTAHHTCDRGRMLVCAVVRTPADGGPTMRARVCPSAASITVEYDAPSVGPTRLSASRTVDVGGGCTS